MKVIKHDYFPITIYEKTLDNGMQVVLVPRPEFVTTKTILQVNFGSKDEAHTIQTPKGNKTIPQGTAHFLEHRIFESKEENLSRFFANHGASINASTGTESTDYYFSTLGSFETLLSYFLNFIQSYQDDEEGIKKEAGIIEREFIRRYESQGSQIRKKMIQTVFPNHHLGKEILGTLDSIASITKEDLALTFTQYYRPNNLVLTIVGNVDIASTISLLETIEKAFPSFEGYPIIKVKEDTLVTGVRQRHDLSYAISAIEDHFYIKIQPYSLLEGVEKNEKDSVLFAFVANLLFHVNAPLYTSWKEQGLLESTLSGDVYNTADSYWMMQYRAHTKKPKALYQALMHVFDHPWDDKVMSEMFSTFKKAMMGKSYRSINDLSNLAEIIVGDATEKSPYLNRLKIVKDITYQDVKEFYKNLSTFDLHYFHIEPIKKDSI
jgi:predicted Zn-dependent peptidase